MHGGLDDAHLQADGKPEEVQIGEVSWRELVEITNKTECDDWLFVLLDGKVRGATKVKSFKAGGKHEREQDLGGEISDTKQSTSLCEV